jgi:hypothetical protein
MRVTTIEGIVKNGRIELSEDLKLPESTKVYVVVPNAVRKSARIMSPRLVDKADAKRFVKTIEDSVDGEV